jgi:polyferredoxin
MPPKLHGVLLYLKYIILVATILLPFWGLRTLFRVCPQVILTSLPNVTYLTVILLVLLLLAVFIDRVWCKYLCPFGALQQVFMKVRRLFRK